MWSLKCQPTDHQSAIITIIPKTKLWWGDTENLSVIHCCSWIRPIHLIKRIQYKIWKKTRMLMHSNSYCVIRGNIKQIWFGKTRSDCHKMVVLFVGGLRCTNNISFTSHAIIIQIDRHYQQLSLNMAFQLVSFVISIIVDVSMNKIG